MHDPQLHFPPALHLIHSDDDPLPQLYICRCASQLSPECSLGPHSRYVLPPTAITPTVLDRQRSTVRPAEPRPAPAQPVRKAESCQEFGPGSFQISPEVGQPCASRSFRGCCAAGRLPASPCLCKPQVRGSPGRPPLPQIPLPPQPAPGTARTALSSH